MKKYHSPMNIIRSIFLLIAFASIFSMAINTWSLEVFLRYFSISSNMIIAFVMLYLVLFLPRMRALKDKELALSLLLWITIYLVAWNGLPFIFWLMQWGLADLSVNNEGNVLVFMMLNILQIVIIPIALYILLRFELNAVFKNNKYNYSLHLGILWLIFLGVSYLVIAAM